MKKLVIYAGIAATTLVAAPAIAADIEVGAPPPYYGRPLAPPPLMFTWTGCYLGGHLGGAFTNNEFSGPVEVTSVPTTVVINDIDFGSNGFLVGGQIGCNYQLPWRWVIGAEGDASWGNIRGGKQLTVSTTLIDPVTASTATVISNGNLSLKADFIATATARLGYAVGFLGQGLIYGKGGAAWVGDRYAFDGGVTLAPTITAPLTFSASETRLGWTVGVGVEWAVLKYWSVKGEYDFLDFGRHSVTLNDPVFGGVSVNVRQQISEVKFGINFRFGPGLVPMY